MDLHDLTKVHLHVHLEGSIRPSTLHELYIKQTNSSFNYSLDQVAKNLQMTKEDNEFKDFLEKFKFIFGCNFTPQILKRITREAIADASDEGVCYLELRFCPHSLYARSGIDIPVAIENILEGIEIGMKEFPRVTCSLLIIIDQQLGIGKAYEAVRYALRYKNEGITGIDIASDPTKIPLITYESVCKFIRDEGLGLTIHAGEFEGPESVRIAVDRLGASRIGHGIRSVEDPDVIELLIKNQVTLEISVTSNIQTKVIPSIHSHPLPVLMKAGVRVTLNTDDPSIFDTTLTKEYKLVKDIFGFSSNDFKQFNLNGIDAAFIDKNLRKKIRKKIEKDYNVIEN